MSNTISYNLRTGLGMLTLHITDDKPPRILSVIGKNGAIERGYAEALCRLAYRVLELGGDLDDIAKELVGITDNTALVKVSSLADAFGQICRKAKREQADKEKAQAQGNGP